MTCPVISFTTIDDAATNRMFRSGPPNVIPLIPDIPISIVQTNCLVLILENIKFFFFHSASETFLFCINLINRASIIGSVN